VVHVPDVADEDRRQRHRELIALKAQRTEHTNQIKGLLAGLGLGARIDDEFLQRVDALRRWDDTDLPSGLRGRVLREYEQWRLVARQIHDLEAERKRQIRDPDTREGEQVRLLLKLEGIGENAARLLVREFFGWRGIRNRRELASLAGLSPTISQVGTFRSDRFSPSGL
jgi:transposase